MSKSPVAVEDMPELYRTLSLWRNCLKDSNNECAVYELARAIAEEIERPRGDTEGRPVIIIPHYLPVYNELEFRGVFVALHGSPPKGYAFIPNTTENTYSSGASDYVEMRPCSYYQHHRDEKLRYKTQRLLSYFLPSITISNTNQPQIPQIPTPDVEAFDQTLKEYVAIFEKGSGVEWIYSRPISGYTAAGLMWYFYAEDMQYFDVGKRKQLCEGLHDFEVKKRFKHLAKSFLCRPMIDSQGRHFVIVPTKESSRWGCDYALCLLSDPSGEVVPQAEQRKRKIEKK